MIFLLVILIFFTAFWVFVRWILSEMAEANFMVTFRTQGEIIPIMEGKRCDRFIMAVDNYLIDPIDFDIYKGSFEPEDLTEVVKHLVKVAKEKMNPKLQDGSENPKFDPGFQEMKLDIPILNKGTADQRYDFDNAKLNSGFRKQLRKANKRTLLEKTFRVVWVGFPPFQVFTYEFTWLKYAQEQARMENGRLIADTLMIPRKDTVDSLYYRYPNYGIDIKDVETGAPGILKDNKEVIGVGERIKVRVQLVMETVTENPQKTLFRTAGESSAGDWLSAVTRAIRGEVRGWIGQTDYDHLTQGKKNVEKMLREIRDRINDGVTTDEGTQISAIQNYGQRIVKLDLVNTDLPEELQAAVNAIYTEEQARRKAEKTMQKNILLAKGNRELKAAETLGLADGLAQIASIEGGEAMYKALQVGQLPGVYAPGGTDRIFLNVDTSSAKQKKLPPPPATPPENEETES